MQRPLRSHNAVVGLDLSLPSPAFVAVGLRTGVVLSAHLGVVLSAHLMVREVMPEPKRMLWMAGRVSELLDKTRAVDVAIRGFEDRADPLDHRVSGLAWVVRAVLWSEGRSYWDIPPETLAHFARAYGSEPLSEGAPSLAFRREEEPSASLVNAANAAAMLRQNLLGQWENNLTIDAWATARRVHGRD
ncbi:MAG: hypothetical protein AAGF12_22520 [Myxococcota bacterium]